jgi:reactive intermediate/imine deaminase
MHRTRGFNVTGRLFSICIGVLSACAAAAADKPEFLNSPGAQPDRPFSEAVRAGDFLFLSGQVGSDPATGRLVPGGIAAESRQILQKIKRVLESNGSSLAAVVKCTAFLADIGEWPAFNTVYREFFSKPFPARSALAASGLVMGARVELECIAYNPRPAH